MIKVYAIQVIKAIANSWYSEVVGEVFLVLKPDSSPFYFFSNNLYFYPDDIQIVEPNKQPLLPVYNPFTYA